MTPNRRRKSCGAARPATPSTAANSTPFLEDGTIYGCDISTGALMGVRLADGERLWQTARADHGRHAPRPLRHGVHRQARRPLFPVQRNGRLDLGQVVAAGIHGNQPVQVLEPTNNDFGRNVVWSHPAFADKSVFARNDKELVRVSSGGRVMRNAMNHVERFRAVMNFQPVDRLPLWEWAMWWDETIARWKTRGAAGRTGHGLRHRPVLRPGSLPAVLVQHHRPDDRGRAAPRRGHRRRTWTTTCGVRPQLFPDHAAAIESMRPWAERAGPRRGRRLDHAGRLLLVPAHADGLHARSAWPSTTSRS